MFAYYLDLAVRSLKRNGGLTVLMIVAIAFGVGASMTTLTVMHVLAADPIPQKSDKLFYVQVDPRRARNVQPGEDPPLQLARYDAEALLRARRADRQVMMVAGHAAVTPTKQGLAPFLTEARWTSADFFRMFDAPFVSGSGWSDIEDNTAARVVVLAKPLALKLFGSVDVIGKTVQIGGAEMRVTGVLDDWRLVPRFYDMSTEVYGKPEQAFVPFSTSRALKFDRDGNMNCWDQPPGEVEALEAPCEWIQFWVELGTADQVAAYRDYLVHYSQDQKKAGRYETEPNVRLTAVRPWLAKNKVVPEDARLQTWVALGFLVVCLVNTIGLLLTKFLRRSSEIGVRRALGASRRAIFGQLLVEAGIVGLVGGIAGLGLALLGLWAVRHQPTEYAELAHLDLPMLGATFGLAILATLLAGILPAWRGCQVSPAIQLKAH